MATIIVETGSIVAGANSYVSTATLTTYAADRGVTLTGDLTVLLLKAMDYVDNLPFKGIKSTKDQPLQWPRLSVYVDGYPVNGTEIPSILKNGLMECAIAIFQNNDPLQNSPIAIKRQKVDVIEVEYADGAAQYEINRRVMNYLKKLLGSTSGGNVITVSKG